MKKAKNKKQLNNEVPEIKAYLSLSKNSPLIIAKAFLLLIQEERGNFKNVSKLAMINRLIGLGLIKGLPYQKSYIKNKKRS